MRSCSTRRSTGPSPTTTSPSPPKTASKRRRRSRSSSARSRSSTSSRSGSAIASSTREARKVAFVRNLATVPTEADAQAYFTQNLAQICPAGKAISHILVATQAEADTIEQELADGADFATIAQQKSTDTQSRRAGWLPRLRRGGPDGAGVRGGRQCARRSVRPPRRCSPSSASTSCAPRPRPTTCSPPRCGARWSSRARPR